MKLLEWWGLVVTVTLRRRRCPILPRDTAKICCPSTMQDDNSSKKSLAADYVGIPTVKTI